MIIIGHWFERSIRLIFKNLKTIKQCLDLYEISGTTVCMNDNYKLITTDTASSTQAIYDVRWNNFLFTRILTLLKPENLDIEVVKEKGSSNIETYFENKDSKNHTSYKSKFLKLFHQGYSFFANKFVRDDDAFL